MASHRFGLMENGAIDGGARKKGRTARKNITVI